MMREQEQKTYARLGECLREAGFTGISLSLTENRSRLTAVRKQQKERQQDSLDRMYVLSGSLEGRRGRVSFTAMPEEERIPELMELMKATAALMPKNGSSEEAPAMPEASREEQEKTAAKEAPAGSFLWEEHETVLPLLLAAEKRACAYPETALVENLSYEQKEERIFLYDGRGVLQLTDATGYHCLRMTVIAKREGDTELANACRYGRNLEETAPEELAEQTAREAIAGLSGRSLPSGSYPVILKNAVVAELLEAYLPAFYGSRLADGTSCLSGKEGEAVAAGALSIRELPELPEGRVSRRIDDEGTPVSEKYLVRNGLLEQPLFNRKSAGEQGKKSTGNGFKPDLQSDIDTGVTNIRLEAGTEAGDLPELLRELGEGLLVTTVDGVFAGTNVKDGSFSLIAGGRIVKEGKTGGAFRQVAIAGNFFEMLKNTRAAGRDYAATTPDCACVLAPSLLAGELVISGT